MAKKKSRRKAARKAASRTKAARRGGASPKRHRAAGGGSKERAIITLKFSRGMLNDMLKDVPSDKMMFQSCPTENHVLWTLGHLAATYAWLGKAAGIEVPALPEGFDKVFGFGAKPTADRGAYPSDAAVRQLYDATFDAFIKGVEGMTERALLNPTAIETGGFARDRLDLIEKASWHEGWHSGQVSTIRRALGLKPLMG